MISLTINFSNGFHTVDNQKDIKLPNTELFKDICNLMKKYEYELITIDIKNIETY
jgi:hypothetical protein